METTEQENINNAVSKALTDFSEKLKEEYRLHGFKTKEFFEVIDKTMGSFHSPQDTSTEVVHTSSEVKPKQTPLEDIYVQKKGCGLNMGSYGVHGDLICGEGEALCRKCEADKEIDVEIKQDLYGCEDEINKLTKEEYLKSEDKQ